MPAIAGFYYALLLAGIMPPKPINDGFTNGLLFYAPWDFMVPCVENAAGDCQYNARVDTGVGIGLGDDYTSELSYDGLPSSPWIGVMEGYGRNADLFHKQIVGNWSSVFTIKVVIDHVSHKRKGDVTFKAADPMAVLYLQDISVFRGGRQSSSTPRS